MTDKDLIARLTHDDMIDIVAEAQFVSIFGSREPGEWKNTKMYSQEVIDLRRQAVRDGIKAILKELQAD